MVILKQKEIKSRPPTDVWVIAQNYSDMDGNTQWLFWDKAKAKEFFNKIKEEVKSNINDEYIDDEDYIEEDDSSFSASSECFSGDYSVEINLSYKRIQ